MSTTYATRAGIPSVLSADERQQLQRLSDACAHCSAFSIRTAIDDGYPVWFLVDGCGDDYGEAFECLDDLEAYISDNEEIAEWLGY